MECQHLTLKKQLVGGIAYYKCVTCGQKHKAQGWDGKVTVNTSKEEHEQTK